MTFGMATRQNKQNQNWLRTVEAIYVRCWRTDNRCFTTI